MSDELPPPPPGITLMSPQEFLDRRSAPSETPRTDAVALDERDGITHPELHETYMAWTDYWALRELTRQLERERNAWEAKFNAECEKHDATTLRAMKAERDLALALDHIEKDDKEIERLNALMESNPSATVLISGEISTAHVYRDACGDMRIAIRYTDATEEDRPATALEVFLRCEHDKVAAPQQ